MNSSKRKTFTISAFVFSAFFLLVVVAFTEVAEAQPQDVSVHDPVMIQQDQTYYMFATAPKVSSITFSDFSGKTDLKNKSAQ